MTKKLAIVAVLLVAAFFVGRSLKNPRTDQVQFVTRQANTFTMSSQDAAALAHDPDTNRYAVVWHSRRQENGTYGIYGRLFDGAGNPLTAERHMNTTTWNAQMRPAAAFDGTGRLWVAWESFGQDGSGWGVVGRCFDGAMQGVSRETVLNEESVGGQGFAAIAGLRDGRAMVAYSSEDVSTGVSGIYVRRMDGVHASVKVSDDGTSAFHPSIAAAPGVGAASRGVGGAVEDRIVVTYAVTGEGNRPEGVVCRVVDTLGRPLGDEVVVSTRPAAGPIEPVVAVDGDGVTVAWHESAAGKIGGDGGHGVFARRLDWGLRPLSEVTRIDDGTGSTTGLAIARGAVAGGVDGRGADGGGADGGGGDGLTRFVYSVYGPDGRETDLRLVSASVDLATISGSDAIAESKGGRRVYHETGASRAAVGAGGALAIAFSGSGVEAVLEAGLGAGLDGGAGLSGGDDTSGAHLGLLFPEGASIASYADTSFAETSYSDSDTSYAGAERAGSERAGAEMAGSGSGVGADVDGPVGASPVQPPTYDPNRALMDRETALLTDPAPAGFDFGFMGIVDTGWTPGDPHMAVGLNHIVMVTNGRIQFFNKGTGGVLFGDELEGGSGFWGSVGAGGFVFDPEVVYDPASDRFFAMANERHEGINHGYLLLAVSDNGNPLGTWHKYRFDVTSLAGDSDIDSPSIAVGPDAVFFIADFFGPDRQFIYMVDKASVLVGDEPVVTNHINIIGDHSFGLPMQYGEAPAQYMIEAFESFSSTAVRFHAITDPLGTPVRETIDVSVPTYTPPGSIPNMGTTFFILAFEARFWSCMYRDGRLWATHHQGNPTHVTWYEFAMHGWPASGETPELVQSGSIDPGGGVRTSFPSLSADSAGNMGITYARSSPSEFFSYWRAVRTGDDPLGTTREPVLVRESTASVLSGRWGDYSATRVDPATPGTFWGVHLYTTGLWRTWVTRFGLPDSTPPAIVEVEPYNGYIDPRMESSNGVDNDLGFSEVRIFFDEFVRNQGGGSLDASAFAVSVSGGSAPEVVGVETKGNPEVYVTLGSPIPAGERMTLTVAVEDMEGNATEHALVYASLPCDVDGSGRVQALDLLRFRQIFFGTFEPAEGTDEMAIDMDRSGVIQSVDLLRFRQLYAGTGNATQAWSGAELP